MMNRLLLSFTLLTLPLLILAQVPQAFNYQAILRNVDGMIKANESVALQISIVNDQGDSKYMKIHNVQTNDFGLVNIVIGQGITSDRFSQILWSSGAHFHELTVNGESMSSSQLLSVPYAIYAENSGNSNELGPFNVEYSVVSPSCNGNADGRIALSITGGKPPYSIS